MTARFLSGAAALAVFPALAWGQATPQGAADLTALFQTYLGATPGVVNVVPEGGAYAVTLDATPLMSMIPAEAGVAMKMTPHRMLLTDNGDGTWGVAQDQALNFGMEVPGVMTMSIGMDSLSCQGSFDARLKAFSQNACTIAGIRVAQKVTDPTTGEVQDTRSDVATMTLTSTAAAGASGGVDGRVTYAATGVSQTMTAPFTPGAPPVTIALAMDSYTVDATSTGLRPDAILGGLAWLVSNPGQAAMTANRGALKDILSGNLPLFTQIDADGTGANLRVDTPIGQFGAATMGFGISLRGAVSDGLFREAISLGGLTLPAGLLPPGTEGLVPADASIDFAVEGFDAAAAAQLLLGLFDLPPDASPAPGFDGQLLQALMPDGSVDIVLAPGEAKNAAYRLAWEGRIQAGPAMMPTGAGKVTAEGWNAVMDMVAALPPDMAMQIGPAMGMAQGLAQQGPNGELVWDLDASVPGTFKVNGMDLMGMQ